MKKRKILVLFPVLGLLLTGCDAKSVLSSVKNWISQNIYHPVKDFIDGGSGEKEKEDKGGEDEKEKEDEGGETQKTVTEITHVYAPADVDKDYVFTVQDVTVDVAYSDGTTGNIRPDSVALDTSEPGEVTGTVTVGEVSAQFTITVKAPIEVETYTPEQVIAKSDEAGENVVTELLQVRGEVAVGMVKSSYGWTGSFICEGEKVLTFDSIKTEESFEGKIVTIQGYAELYQGEYKIGYLPASVSPTGKAYEPVLVSVEDAPAKVITAITNVTGPQQVYVGTELTAQDFILDVEFEGGKTGQVRPDSVSGDTSEPGEAVEITLTAGSVQVVYNIKVVPQPVSPVHDGTLEDPYTVSDAKLIFDGLADGEIGGECYVTGTIADTRTPSVSSGRGRFDLTDGLCPTNLYVYNIDKIGGGTGVTVDDIPVGAVVVAKGTIKNYQGTFELCYNKENPAISCELISVVKPTILVSEIQLTSTEENLVVGLADLVLGATVLPQNASNKSLVWSSSNEAVATVKNGVVHAVAEGDAVITAAATDGSGIEATCTVHVSVPQKEVVGVVVSTMPKVEYNEGEVLDLTGMELTITYNDQSVDEHVSEGYVASIAADHALTPEDTELVISYAGVDAEPITLTVTPKPQPVHAGTQDDPYTIKDCEIVYANAKLDEGKDIGAEVYVAGTIVADPAPAIASGRAKVYISDNSSENTLYIHQANNIGGSNNLTLADVPAGSEIVAKGTLKNYNGAMQMCYVKDVANCEFISIEKPFIAPETVEITSGSELGVGSNMNLAATVGPEGAAQDVEWTIVTGGDFATLSDGVLTGVAAGDVTVRATAVGYENVYAEKTITVSSSVVPTEQVVYTLDGTVTGGTSGYAEASEITQAGVVWSVEGNTTINPWRIGGKNLSGVDRVAKSTQVVTSDDLSKVSVTTGTKTLSAVNSITIKVGSTEGTADLGSQTFTTDLVSTTLEFERPSNANWSNAFITVVFNVNAAGSNQYIQLLAINLYAVK